MCPVRTLLKLAFVLKTTGVHTLPATTFLFPHVDASDNIHFSTPMQTRDVRDHLRSDLQALGVQLFSLYGTHSFRRGGTQWWHIFMGRSVPALCAWGGWALTDAMTILRYLYSENDARQENNQLFMKMEGRVGITCPSCKRSCGCHIVDRIE